VCSNIDLIRQIHRFADGLSKHSSWMPICTHCFKSSAFEKLCPNCGYDKDRHLIKAGNMLKMRMAPEGIMNVRWRIRDLH